jgi:hypothetical protein
MPGSKRRISAGYQPLENPTALFPPKGGSSIRKPLHYRVMFIVSAPVHSPMNYSLIANPAHQQVISFDNQLDADIAADAYEARSNANLTFTAIRLYQE